METFDINRINELTTYKERIIYCDSCLGRFIGHGTSRFVYSFDETHVLKLAISDVGLLQNKEEITNMTELDYNFFPKIDKENTDIIGFKWIVCEKVKPFVLPRDFQTLFRKTFKQYCDELEFANQDGNFRTYNVMFDEIMNYVQEHKPCLFDMKRLCSYGYRECGNGEYQLVFLDNGMTQEILETYYQTRRVKKNGQENNNKRTARQHFKKPLTRRV